MKRVGVVAALVLVACGAVGCSAVGDGTGSEAAAPSTALPSAPSSALEVVQAHVASFNRHDAESMAARVASDFVWLGVAGDEVTVEARGRDALAEGLRSYFASLPSVRSEIEEATVSGSFVAVRERATWIDAGGAERSQVALGVYEVRDGLIQRVWYYPAER